MPWGDEDDEDELFIPPPQVIGPDGKGIKTYITVNPTEDGKYVKVTRRVRVVERKRRVPKAIGRRTEWARFGQCAESKDEGVTYTSVDEIRIEHPDDQVNREKAEEDQLMEHLRAGAQKRAERKAMAAAGIEGYDADGNKTEGTLTGGGLRRGTALSEAIARGEDGKDGSLGNKYVPPSMRAGATTQFREREEETNTLRVTNISEDTSERDLQELFRPFGSVARIYLAKDRETQMSRGFAYVSYHNRQDAERAMEKLHGFGYDHLILSIEWAKPSVRDDSAGTQNSMKQGTSTGSGVIRLYGQ